ncbi:hypothetical protein BYI23_E003640 (plasmid) [Burkholderia sp. YI23]|nr:hypothetical protein BYI23_E003640 [Burkholderia sp. YI23]
MARMEHLVRVQNERDRKLMCWLRERVSDESITAAVRRCGGRSKPYLSAGKLGLTAPSFLLHHANPSPIAEKSLAAIREILAAKTNASARSRQ